MTARETIPATAVVSTPSTCEAREQSVDRHRDSCLCGRVSCSIFDEVHLNETGLPSLRVVVLF